MTHLLSLLWSAPFLIGLAVGIAGYHCFAMARCRWLNKHQPLPGGRERRHRVSNVWVGGIVASLVLLYVLSQTEQRATHAEECYREFTDSIIAYAKISEENDRLSRQHRALLTEHNNKTVDWINKLVYPPPDIAALPPGDSRRSEWGFGLTRAFFDQIEPLGVQMHRIEEQQNDLEQWRRDHPVDQLKCGVVNG